MELLVIGSCTGDKEIRDCPSLLTEGDFNAESDFRKKEAELQRWSLPAAKIYTGWQHKYMMRGVYVLRQNFGEDACSVRIISAGYGLVAEQQSLVPYEATFQGKRKSEIRQRAEFLGIPKAVRESIKDFEAVVFLLGNEYLTAVGSPLQSRQNQKIIYFTSNSTFHLGEGSVIVPAGKPETRFGAGTVSLKGKMFERFASGLATVPSMWSDVLSDVTPRTILRLIESGRKLA